MTARRNLYRRPRAPARHKGEIRNFAPLMGLPDAQPLEIATAIFACCESLVDVSGHPRPVKTGRAIGYCPLINQYTVTAKSLATGIAQDFTVEGEVVMDLILLARQLNGGVKDDQAHVRNLGGISHRVVKAPSEGHLRLVD